MCRRLTLHLKRVTVAYEVLHYAPYVECTEDAKDAAAIAVRAARAVVPSMVCARLLITPRLAWLAVADPHWYLSFVRVAEMYGLTSDATATHRALYFKSRSLELAELLKATP